MKLQLQLLGSTSSKVVLFKTLGFILISSSLINTRTYDTTFIFFIPVMASMPFKESLGFRKKETPSRTIFLMTNFFSPLYNNPYVILCKQKGVSFDASLRHLNPHRPLHYLVLNHKTN